MADNDKIGLQAIFESEDFQQGIAEYNSAISESVGITEESSDTMQSSFEALSAAIDQMAGDTASSLVSMSDAISETTDNASGAVDEASASIQDADGEMADAAEEDAQAFSDSRDEIIDSVGGAADAVDGSSTEIEGALEGVDQKVTETKDNTKDASDSMSDSLDGLASAGKVSMGILAAAVAAVTAELVLATDAALETERVMAASDFAIEKFGKSTGITREQVDEIAESMSKVVPIDDEVITQAITMGMTFDGVNHNNIEPLTKAAGDLALFTGKDMVSAMKELGLAVSDPDKALRLFKDAHITLTDAEKNHLKALKAGGDEAKISSYILGLVTEKVGGFGEALGQTAGGKITLMQTALGNMQEQLGGGFLNAVADGADAIAEFAGNPETMANLKSLGEGLGQVASLVVNGAVQMADVLANNQGIIVGALTAITVALLLTAGAAVAVFIATAEVSVPLLAIAAAIALAATLIGVVVAAMSTIWIKNWGDIQGKTKAVWDFLQPIFQFIGKVLQTVVGVAIAGLVLQWKALTTVMGVVGDWINTNLMPLFNAVAGLIQAVVVFQLKIFAAQFETLMEAGRGFTEWADTNLMPIFKQIGDVISTYVMPILIPLADFLLGPLLVGFNGIGSAVEGLITLITNLTNALNNISLPPDLTPGSPTPFEIGLLGINNELEQLAGASLPAVTAQMNILGSTREVANSGSGAISNVTNSSSQVTKNYIYGPRYSSPKQSGMLDFFNGLT